MCGRYVISSTKKIKETYNVSLNENFNVTPKNEVLVLDKDLIPTIIKWKYSPSWAKKPFDLINARSETIEDKPSFKNSLRCIFVADGYYEWKKESKKTTPYYHYFEKSLIYFAGIYNNTSGCCIVTKPSDDSISHIHHRQPVILKENDFIKWINFTYNYDSEYDKNLKSHAVSIEVNSPLNNSKKNIAMLNKQIQS